VADEIVAGVEPELVTITTRATLVVSNSWFPNATVELVIVSVGLGPEDAAWSPPPHPSSDATMTMSREPQTDRFILYAQSSGQGGEGNPVAGHSGFETNNDAATQFPLFSNASQ